MNYLVDTRTLLWSFMDTDKLSKQIKAILIDENNEIFFSPISLWEISIKYKLNKLNLYGGMPDDFFLELTNSFFQCKTVDNTDLITNYKLPIHHNDPFDRFLIWEAIKSNFILISSDKNMNVYEEAGLQFIN
jgi:PIN domain nuclease of toxin-antitoxin system